MLLRMVWSKRGFEIQNVYAMALQFSFLAIFLVDSGFSARNFGGISTLANEVLVSKTK